jgi:hypothetical protein
VLIPRGPLAKAAALGLLGLALASPRVMQFLHPHGNFHTLTLTAYALLVAAAALLLVRGGSTLVRNGAVIAVTLLVGGYVMQCNWISTVNHMNTLAHYTTLTQVLARLRALPERNWDGRTVAVVGRYDMPSDFPFLPATGVANEFMAPKHMSLLAQLMRDEARFVRAGASMPRVLEFAARSGVWPSPDSVGIVDGMGVVVFSSPEKGGKKELD